MKKIVLTTFLLVSALIVLESFAPLRVARRDGTDPGHTGSPGDSLKNCTVCHGGIAHHVDGWITSNVPAEGYTPGVTYTIKATNTEFGATRFGFQVSPQKLNGDLQGTLVITDTVKTKLVGNDKYVTYRSGGVDGIDSLSWEFDWIAPAAGTGDVIFYGAFNSNFEGHKGGDQTYLSVLQLKEAEGNSTPGVYANPAVFNVYPNPAKDHVMVTVDLKAPANITLEILDVSGKRVELISEGTQSGSIAKRIYTGNLDNGIYLIHLKVGENSSVQKIQVLH